MPLSQWKILTDFDESVVGNWWHTKYIPLLESQRQNVYKAAWAEVEKVEGALLETCDEGTKCRDLIEEKVKTAIKKQW